MYVCMYVCIYIYIYNVYVYIDNLSLPLSLSIYIQLYRYTCFLFKDEFQQYYAKLEQAAPTHPYVVKTQGVISKQRDPDTLMIIP